MIGKCVIDKLELTGIFTMDPVLQVPEEQYCDMVLEPLGIMGPDSVA